MFEVASFSFVRYSFFIYQLKFMSIIHNFEIKLKYPFNFWVVRLSLLVHCAFPLFRSKQYKLKILPRANDAVLYYIAFQAHAKVVAFLCGFKDKQSLPLYSRWRLKHIPFYCQVIAVMVICWHDICTMFTHDRLLLSLCWMEVQSPNS